MSAQTDKIRQRALMNSLSDAVQTLLQGKKTGRAMPGAAADSVAAMPYATAPIGDKTLLVHTRLDTVISGVEGYHVVVPAEYKDQLTDTLAHAGFARENATAPAVFPEAARTGRKIWDESSMYGTDDRHFSIMIPRNEAMLAALAEGLV
ncbi:MAG: hypothetical protein KGJ06_00465, partial [Pseudomonadota bacterium]|nr:hypothetical protein [Pseudomonadota bacterium]